jgi:hypothetical protein
MPRKGVPACPILIAMAGLIALPAHADNPGYDRPGLGFTPAALDAGDITIEQGFPTWTRDRQAGVEQSQYTTDSLLRLGVGGPFEVQLGTSPFNALHESGAGTDSWSYGRGDSILALKYAPSKPDAMFTWGLLGSVEFTDGASAIRNERRQYLLGANFNWQLSDTDGVGTYIEEVRSCNQNQTTIALNESHALSRRLIGYVEAAQVHEPGLGSGTEAGAGVAWLVGRRVQLDGGFRRSISGHAQQWMVSMGVSVFLGH